jgi:hypothetical protein
MGREIRLLVRNGDLSFVMPAIPLTIIDLKQT